MTKEEIEELKALGEAATAGPWGKEQFGWGGDFDMVGGLPNEYSGFKEIVADCNDGFDDAQKRANAAFIIAGRNNWGALLEAASAGIAAKAEVERLREALAELVGAISEVQAAQGDPKQRTRLVAQLNAATKIARSALGDEA